MPVKAKLEIILDIKEPKKHSVKFKTDKEGVEADNIYVSNAGLAKLGNPDKLKITITAAE